MISSKFPGSFKDIEDDNLMVVISILLTNIFYIFYIFYIFHIFYIFYFQMECNGTNLQIQMLQIQFDDACKFDFDFDYFTLNHIQIFVMLAPRIKGTISICLKSHYSIQSVNTNDSVEWEHGSLMVMIIPIIIIIPMIIIQSTFQQRIEEISRGDGSGLRILVVCDVMVASIS